ncbi:cobinamide phosphate guanylyltransferase [Alteromonadales bacterium alter-6D02]|nr:cobinamide phosphate guanylyltransferase [Alteromonadales bacterium alter-6D02]
MKTLYFGGQKSGKSNLAAAYTLSLQGPKPHYIATYDNSYHDEAMAERVFKHQVQRQDDFITLEQSHDLSKVMRSGETYLIDCLSMWIFNNLEQTEEYLINQLAYLFSLDCNIVFVLNDVSCGVIPMEAQSRRFVDMSGIIGQYVAAQSDEVYRVSYGLPQQLK